MGIKVNSKTNKTASLKLMNEINSFLFEQEYGELRSAPEIVKKRLRLAVKGLASIL